VPGVNISRIEAKERSAHIALESYHVTLDVTGGDQTFYSKTVARFSCNTPGYHTFIDAVAKRIISATLNSQPVDVSEFDGETIYLSNLASENELIIEMEANYSKTGEGLQRSVDPVDNEVYLYSQGETAHNRKMYASFDQPNLKAIFTFSVVAPDHWEVIANSPVDSKSNLDQSKTLWVFLPTPRISTYITVIIAGPYYQIHDEYVGKKVIPLGIYCRNSMAQYVDAENIFLATKQGFAFFERVFGLAYPFEKYDQVAVVDYNWGAMENSGAVTFKEDLLIFRSRVTETMYSRRTQVILHEMAHMWFGDLVTMEWWDDLWLNESFAEWSSFLALAEGTKFTNAWTVFIGDDKNWAYRQDQLLSTHPIVTQMEDIEQVDANFDGISYAKAASVLKQLFAHVGRENFIAGLQKYFAKHAWKNTVLQDFLVELETTSGRDLQSWSDTWLKTAGINTLRPVLEIADGTYKSVAIAQEAPLVPAGSTELRPHRIRVGLYDLHGNQLLVRKSVELDISGSLSQVNELVGEPVADLVLLNDGDITYAKVRFDDRSISTLKNHLGKITDSLARAICWSATWDMVRDSELSASDFVSIALSGLQTEEDVTVATTVAAQLSVAVETYSHPSHRDQLRSAVAAGFENLLNAAKPGSDFQLQYAKSFAGIESSPAQNDRLTQLLDGNLSGLVVDANLRWLFVKALAERGLKSLPDLDAELLNDNTMDGQINYDTCVASLPTVEAKAKAWEEITTVELTNSKSQSKMIGFQRPLHRDLLVNYVDQYFSQLINQWETRSPELATTFVEMMYPMFIITEETLTKSNDWLNGIGKDAPAALRRYVVEAGDNLARALRVQSKDA
jgi:aminopeptidase N